MARIPVNCTFAPRDHLLRFDRRSLVSLGRLRRIPGGKFLSLNVHSEPSFEQISTAIDRGRYDGDDHAALWIDDDLRRRLGAVILEDLADGGPMIDLRLAEIPRDAQDVSACRLCHRGVLP